MSKKFFIFDRVGIDYTILFGISKYFSNVDYEPILHVDKDNDPVVKMTTTSTANYHYVIVIMNDKFFSDIKSVKNLNIVTSNADKLTSEVPKDEYKSLIFITTIEIAQKNINSKEFRETEKDNLFKEGKFIEKSFFLRSSDFDLKFLYVEKLGIYNFKIGRKENLFAFNIMEGANYIFSKWD